MKIFMSAYLSIGKVQPSRFLRDMICFAVALIKNIIARAVIMLLDVTVFRASSKDESDLCMTDIILILELVFAKVLVFLFPNGC